MTLGEKINAANAGEDIPGMTKKTILHSGPPVTWENMCDPTKGAVIGALIYEGLAKTPEEAEKLAASGEITFDPCHHHNAVGPMCGIVSYSMPVWKFCVSVLMMIPLSPVCTGCAMSSILSSRKLWRSVARST